MRRSTLFAVVILIASAPFAVADTINLSTGLDASNNLILTGGVADAHWTVSEQAGGTGAAQTVYPNNADWFGGWLANGPNSDWIARNANVTNNGPAPYTFTTTFDLTGFTLSTVAINGLWAIDDQGTIDLNGHVLSTLGSGAWGALTAFSAPTGSAFFNQGLNTLNITITADDQFLEGVRADATLTGTRAVPEPASLVLLGLGSAALGFKARRRRSRAVSAT